MLFIYIGCVLQLFLCMNHAITTTTPEPMPPKLLETCLKHVNMLLADVDDRIGQERQLISEIDNESDKVAVTDEALFHTAMTTHNEPVSKAPPKVYQRGLVANENILNPTTSLNQGAKELIGLWKLANVERTIPELETSDPFDHDEFTISTASTVTVNQFDLTPIKQLMQEYMQKHRVSYCVGAVYGALEAVHRKTDVELARWDEEFTNTIWRMGREGKMDCFGAVLKMRLMALATWSMLTPTVYARRFMHQVYRALQAGNLLAGKEKEIILTYDSLFTDEEGNELLNSVVVISAKEISDKEVAGKLCEFFLTRFIAPVIRLCGTYQLNTLINEVNIAYSNNYPTHSRRKGIISSLFENNPISDELLRRFLCADDRDTTCDYKKNLRYLILKLPTLFEEFLTLERYSEERKNHLFKLKKYTSNDPHSQSTNLFRVTKKIQAISEKRNHLEELDLQYFQRRSLKVPTKNPKSSKGMQRPDFRIRSIYNSDGKYNIRNEQNILKHYTPKTSRNKTVLKRIIDDSSYSDEEMYLRVMLKDAFFHGDNITKSLAETTA